jgi:hypothetical protein
LPWRNAARLLLALTASLCAGLVAPAVSAASGTFADASSDGSKVVIYTTQQMINADTDGSQDLYQRAGTATNRLSQGLINGNGAFDATYGGASTDGSSVFFTTSEPLLSSDTDTSQDVYVRAGGTTAQVSQGQVNGNGAFDSFFAGASDNGSTVFFYTDEPLVSGDTDSSYDLYQRSGGVTDQVSQGLINGNGAFGAFFAGASSDGSKVFFYTDEPLVSGDTDTSQDIYQRSAGTTDLVSQGQINGNGAFDAVFERASSDGSTVFFSTFEKLVSGGVGDTDSSRDIYARSGGATSLVSQGQINGNGAFNATFADASSDGSSVFFSSAEKLGTGDTDSSQDYYVRSGGATNRVSQGLINGNGAFSVADLRVSTDGLRAFFTTTEKLVSGDTDNSRDVYERSGGTTTRVSQGQINGNGAAPADLAGISTDGLRVFFTTSEGLVSGDIDSGFDDIYERSSGATTQVSQGQINGNGDFHAEFAGSTDDGSIVFFQSEGQLTSTDADDASDVFQRSGGTTTLVSVEKKPPDTTLNSGPSGTVNDPTPTFTATSSEPGSSFECKVDSGAYVACGSPYNTPHLGDGSHTVRLRAKDAAGNLDPTPSVRSFSVLTASIRVSGSSLIVNAVSGATDNVIISRPITGTLRVTDFPSGPYAGSGIHAGTGCTRTGDYGANCSAAGITLIQASTGNDDDSLVNSTGIKSSLNGGPQDDVVTGGGANDTLTPGPGADTVKGMNGNDQIFARDFVSDTLIHCDGDSSPGGADKADLDLLPKDPNSVVIGCEMKTRH